MKKEKIGPKTNKEVLSLYAKLSDSKKVGMLWEALDNMQQYNGRSKQDCIIYAMGYTPAGYMGSEFER